MPGFRLDGKMLVWFGAAAHHCSFFPGGIVSEFKKDLAKYDTSKGTIRFDPAHPLPATLVPEDRQSPNQGARLTPRSISMHVTDAQREVRTVFIGGFVGQAVSSGIWLVSAALAMWMSPKAGSSRWCSAAR